MRGGAAIALWVAAAGGCAAQALDMPASSAVLAEESLSSGPHTLVIGPANSGSPATLSIDGPLARTSWRVDRQGITTAQVLGPMQDQLLERGFQPLFSCADVACGGFDFRFALTGFRAPEMFVDLGDFAYFAAKGPDGVHAALLASRSNAAGYLELTMIGGDAPSFTESAPVVARAEQPKSLTEQLDTFGHVVLEGVAFERGSAALAPTSSQSLAELAAYMQARPDLRFALVGHTDSDGSLEVNIRLSKTRAQAVLTELTETYAIPAEQLTAEGMGYLAPRANNLTPEGRQRNRRVEAIILSRQ